MKKSICLLPLLTITFSSITSFSQSPGGIGAPTFWIRGTSGTSTTVNGAALATWTSGGSVVSSVTQVTAANRPLYRDGSGAAAPLGSTNNVFNYNPYVFFDGVNDNLASTTSYDLGSSSSSGNGITQLAVVHPNNTAGIVYFEWNGPNAMIKCKSDGPQCVTDGLGSAGTNNQYNTLNNTIPRIQHMIGFDNGLLTNTAGANGFSGYNHIVVPTLSSNNNPSGSNADRTNVGCNVNTGEFSMTDIAEIIIFNRNITAAEMLRVNSFLAIKYGITLGGNGSSVNYNSSSGTTVWNGLAAYQNNVIGIARDDNSGLLQKQSHTSDDTLRIYLSTLAATNTANSGTFSANNSFVMIGSNTGKLCATNASNVEVPTGLTNCTLYSRLEREWKVERSNMTQNFNIDVKLNNCANLANIAVADLRLLVDDDGNFANGGTQCYYNGDGTGIVFSYTNPLITVTGISTTHIPNNTIKYITIASINSATPLPVSLLSFDAELNESRQVNLTWKTEAELNSNHFEIYKSTDFDEWNWVGNYTAAGTSYTLNNYSTIDADPFLGTTYYRLVLKDNDGQSSLGLVRAVYLDQVSEFTIYPNPATDQVTITGKGIVPERVIIRNSIGQRIPLRLIATSKNAIVISVEDLASGIYFVSLGDEEDKFVKLIRH